HLDRVHRRALAAPARSADTDRVRQKDQPLRHRRGRLVLVWRWSRTGRHHPGGRVRLPGCADQACGPGRSAIAVRQGDGAGGAAQGFQPGGDDQAHARGQRLSQPPDAELMAEVTMPRLSDTMEEGTIAAWLKKPGEQVSKGDVIAQIETDKATMDLTA